MFTANGQPTASTASHTILTASSPANQLAWEALPGPALFFGSIEATYEGNFSANTTDFGVINRNWVAGTHANSGNGINYDLNGIYSAVDRIVLLNDVNSPNANDGIASFTVNLYDKTGALLGAEPFTATNSFALQTFEFSTTYHNVASYDLVITQLPRVRLCSIVRWLCRAVSSHVAQHPFLRINLTRQ